MTKKFCLTALILLAGPLISSAQLPDLDKVFDRNETFLVSKSENKGRPIYSFVTNEEFAVLKAAFLKAMGEEWKEIKRYNAGNKTGITGEKRKDLASFVGDIRLANPKDPKNHVILAVFKTPNEKFDTDYSMMILVDEAPPKVEEPPKKD